MPTSSSTSNNPGLTLAPVTAPCADQKSRDAPLSANYPEFPDGWPRDQLALGGSAIETGTLPDRMAGMSKRGSVSHDPREETPEAKARWFRSLTMAERMQMLCELTDLALAIAPDLPEKNRAQSAPGRIRIVSPA